MQKVSENSQISFAIIHMQTRAETMIMNADDEKMMMQLLLMMLLPADEQFESTG